MPGPRNIIILYALCAATLAAPSMADTLPAAVRACIGDADAARRLACYDREIARAIAPADTFAPTSARPASVPTPAPVRHVTAKVSALRQSGDTLIVTLDNGDVWEQSAPATSQLNLHPGDTVQLDHEMANWFLSNRYGDSVQVRLRQP